MHHTGVGPLEKVPKPTNQPHTDVPNSCGGTSVRALRWSAIRCSLHSGGQGSGGQPDHTGVGGLIGGKKTEIKNPHRCWWICFSRLRCASSKCCIHFRAISATFVCLVSADMAWRSPQRYVHLSGPFTVPAGQWDNELSSRSTSHQVRLDVVIDY